MISKMNKILLVLIVLSGFLLIFYANNFTRHNLRNLFHPSYESTNNNNKTPQQGRDAANGDHNNPSLRLLMDDDENNNDGLADEDWGDDILMDAAGLMADGHGSASIRHRHRRLQFGRPTSNRSEYNLFVVYSKETDILQAKYELLLKSLLKYTTVEVHVHVITDEGSEYNAERILKEQMLRYHRHIYYTLYDVDHFVSQIQDIALTMAKYFSSNSGTYFNDPLLYLSLGLHRIVGPKMHRAILIDCDLVFRTDVKQLFDQFRHFKGGELFGLGPELTSNYYHVLARYRAENPNTLIGSPYYPRHTSNAITMGHNKHGYPGFNSGVVLIHFHNIRRSAFYEDSLKQEQVKRLAGKYHCVGNLGDQDFLTLFGYEYPGLVYRMDCVWNRQLCTWWKEHGHSTIFDTFFHCEGKIRIYHGNCNTRVPE